MEKIAFRLASWLKSEVPEHPYSIERLQFGFHVFLNTLFTISAASLLGIILGNYRETMQVLAYFGLLRAVSGGFHFKSALLCIAVSAGVAALLPTITLSDMTVLVINIINITGILLLAPSGIEEQTRIPSKYYPLLKFISSIIVSTNFFVQSELLAVTWFIQVMSLIKFRKFMERR